MAKTQLIRALGYIPAIPQIYIAPKAIPAPSPLFATKEARHE